MSQGTIKWFDRSKGYGFISADDSEIDIFVHYSNFTERDLKLKEGDRVAFEIVNGEKGPKANQLSIMPSSDFKAAV